MMKAKALSGYLWGEAVTMTMFILNRSPTRVVDGKTPFEAWHREMSMVHFFSTFNCIAHVKNTYLGLKKLDDQSHKTILVRYESGSKASRCYDPIEQLINMSRDVIFDEAGKWCWKSDGQEAAPNAGPFTIEYVTEIVQALGQELALLAKHAAEPIVSVGADDTEPEELDLDADHDDAPLQLCSINEVVGEGTAPGLARRLLDGELNFMSAEEPTTFHEAEQEVPWHATMTEEMWAIQENGT
jgi:hypothetical protein